ncbi:hypothetical protein RHGRI_008011 [Rhododendron griersonianum]|uniref:Secreted protein n=1 Tax=Rhododendron griersonianum TaxID=479676 RepID=A0AAV6L1Z3_9ERIC|nr:hypothetical protein RHGRI_008011 [Rhododendron griersonianum]
MGAQSLFVIITAPSILPSVFPSRWELCPTQCHRVVRYHCGHLGDMRWSRNCWSQINLMVMEKHSYIIGGTPTSAS